MQDRSIDNALLALRKQIIRGNGGGLEHVEALLALRGVHLPHVHSIYGDRARRGLMPVLILEALRGGPKRLHEIAEHVAQSRPEAAPERAQPRTAQALTKLHKAGLVRREGRVWKAI